MSQLATPPVPTHQETSVVEPDYGAYGAAFPLWAAKEAKEAIIKTMDAQSAMLSIYEARATSLMGWLGGIVIASVSAGAPQLIGLSGGLLHKWQIGLLLASVQIPAAVSGIYLASSFRPKTWGQIFWDVSWLTTHVPQNPSELEILQDFARKGASRLEHNDAVLRNTYAAVTAGRRWFLAIPAALTVTCLVLMAMSAA